MRSNIKLALGALVGVGLLSAGAIADEDVSIVVNPRTGQAALRNDTSSSIAIDGYLLRASAPTFDPVAWNSLEEQGVSGWFDGPAAANRLGDTNLFGASVLAPGASLPIGSPYLPFTPGAIGEVEPTFSFTYSVPGQGSFAGDVEFSVRNTVVLVVDAATGSATLENQSAFDVDIEAYLIRSPEAVLSPSGWAPLQGSDSAWRASTGASTRLAEGNLFGSTFLAANGGSLSIGSPIDPLVLDDETDLTLEYRVPGVGTLIGSVLFTSAPAVDLPGDYNSDGRVDAADYTVWRDGNAPAPNNGPAGYTTWANNYGATASSAAVAGNALAIPEPSALVLLALSATACLGARSRAAG